MRYVLAVAIALSLAAVGVSAHLLISVPPTGGGPQQFALPSFQTAGCSQTTGTQASSVACTITNSYRNTGEIVVLGWCGDGSCSTAGAIFNPTNVTLSSGTPCQEITNTRLQLSQSGLDGDMYWCPAINGGTSDIVTATFSGLPFYPNIMAGPIYGALSPVGGNHLGISSGTSISLGTSSSLGFNDFVFSRASAFGQTVTQGSCCVAFGPSGGAYQVNVSPGTITNSYTIAAAAAAEETIVAFTPNPSPPVASATGITSISSAAVAVGASAGTTIVSLTATAANNNFFTGVWSNSDPSGLLQIVGTKLAGYSLQLVRVPQAADVGTHTSTISATENNATVNQTFTLTINPSSGATAPPQAVAQGFTTNALNADFTTGSTTGQTAVCLTCNAGDETPGFQWYCDFKTILVAGCDGTGRGGTGIPQNVTYPYSDGGNGTGLRIINGPCCAGSFSGRTGISSISYLGSQGTDHPLNGYFEYTVRYPDWPNMALWSNFWSVATQCAKSTCADAQLDYNTEEYDWGPEFHGGQNYITTGAGTHNWICNYDNDFCNWGVDETDVRSFVSFDPTQINTFGALVYQVSANLVAICGYVNNQPVNASRTLPSGSPAVPANCAVRTINHNGPNPGPPYTSATFCGADLKTNCIEGSERVAAVVDLTGNCSGPGFEGDFSCFGANQFTSMVVYKVRVWSCSSWQTTECSSFNPN